MCKEKKITGGKREKKIFFYYFIRQFILFYWVYVKIKTRKYVE